MIKEGLGELQQKKKKLPQVYKEPYQQKDGSTIYRYTPKKSKAEIEILLDPRWYQVKGDPRISETEILYSVTTALQLVPEAFQLKNFKQKQLLQSVADDIAPHLSYDKLNDRSKDEVTWTGNLGKVFTRARTVGKKHMEWAGTIGSFAHEIVAMKLKGENPESLEQQIPVDMEQEVFTSVDNFTKWQQADGKHVQFYPTMIEEPIWNPHEKYAGTFDAIGYIDNEPVLIDWKTGYVGEKAFLQLGALSGAWHALHKQIIRKGLIIQIPRDKDTFVVHELDNLQEWYEAFLAINSLFRTLATSQIPQLKELVGIQDREYEEIEYMGIGLDQ